MTPKSTAAPRSGGILATSPRRLFLLTVLLTVTTATVSATTNVHVDNLSQPEAPPSRPQAPPSRPQAPPPRHQTLPSRPQAPPPRPQTPPSKPGAPPPAARPHVVFVMADDLGYGDIGYHNRRVHSPSLDRLSQAGVRLENYYVQPVCSPTRSQFMSGRMQIHMGNQHKNLRPRQPAALPRDSPTLAEKLRASGYATHAVGKWHLGFYTKDVLPTRRGFETFYGLYTGGVRNHYTFKKCARRRCGLDLHDDKGEHFQPARIKPVPRTYSTDLFTWRAEKVIGGHDPNTPLFLYLAYTAIHKPLQAPRRYARQNWGIKNRARRIHVSMVTALDKGVQRVVNALRRKGIWNNTVLIFSSDNGGLTYSRETSRPLRGHKGSLLEGGVRAVAFVTSPLLQTTGYSSTALMHVSDWYPTLLGLAGADLSGTKNVYGFDQWSAISRGCQEAGQRSVLLHNIDPLTRLTGSPPMYNDTFDTRIRAALRMGDYKILTGVSRNNHILLYNVRTDPSETSDLTATRPDLVRTMLRSLQAFQKTAVTPFTPPNTRKSPIRDGVWGPWI